MSELKVDKITPRLGTTLTLGDAGDTINFGSGVLPNFENLTVTGDLTVDTNSLKVDSTNNFVGIGTASPTVALDVVGAITATGNITGTLATASQPNITSVGTLTSATVSGDLTVDTNTLHVDSTNNRVGIGNSSPIAPLTVGAVQETGTDRASIAVKTISNSLAIGESAIQIEEQSGTEGYFMGVDSTGGLFFSNSGSANKTLYLGDDDNVGIGTGSPSTTLDVNGTITANRIIVDTTTLVVDATNNRVGIGTASPDRELTVGNVANARIGILSSDNTTGASQLQFGDPDNSQIGRIYYEHSDNSMRFHTNNTEWMRIESNGQVGIGTTSADAKLHVANANAATQFKLEHTSATNNAVFGVDSTSNLRIYIGGTHKLNIDPGGHIIPQASNSYDLGSSTRVWRNIYTSDFHMTNEGLDKGNDIDGTKGSWTFQEGENDLFLINNKNGKKYKFNLTEIV